MATPQDVQDLLRILTTGRGKLPMLDAMARIRTLQTGGLRSVSDVANADLAALSQALGDEKAAKALKTACVNSVDPSAKKRAAPEGGSSAKAKRIKYAYELNDGPRTPPELEASLALPTPSTDEEEIAKTVVISNRAPLVLAFAVALLEYTMPEQPLSSRLSLAQAVVSANSRSKAVSIGIEHPPSVEQQGWGHGQPKVRIMGREVYVLKRMDHDWKAPQEGFRMDGDATGDTKDPWAGSGEDGVGSSPISASHNSQWTVSEKVTLKNSTFVARCIAVDSSAHARRLLKDLLDSNAELRGATHNVTAWRVPTAGYGGISEECNDDGETGGGHHVLQILRSVDLVGVMLLVTRWYGGVLLGPDRWRLISEACHDALANRLRVSRLDSSPTALWGLDLEAAARRGRKAEMALYRPQTARSYIGQAFASEGVAQPSSAAAVALEKERNLGLVLGALHMLFASWAGRVGHDDLNLRAWDWYVRVRPEVAGGVAGWGAKGPVRLAGILDLRRKDAGEGEMEVSTAT